MLKNRAKKSEAIEGFSVLKMKQEVQDKIYHEIKGMNHEEICDYFRKGSEKFRATGLLQTGRRENSEVEIREKMRKE